jgi:bile acid-coenzyme A ligase
MGEMVILNEAGQAADTGEVGEIYMRPNEGVPTPYRYIGAVAKATADGWESLGDLGWMDADGYVYISDRRTDMIVSGGANVYPAEIEAALEAHPKVHSVVVVGIPHPDLGHVPHALVQSTDATEEELLGFLAEHLARNKIPRSMEFVAEPLRDDAGKARRSALRDEVIARLGSNVWGSRPRRHSLLGAGVNTPPKADAR